MSNVPEIQFIFQWKADGVSTTVDIDLKDGPLMYRPAQVSYTLMKDLASNPSGVENLNCDGGLTLAFTSISHGTLALSVTSGTPGAGQYYTVTGNMLF